MNKKMEAAPKFCIVLLVLSIIFALIGLSSVKGTLAEQTFIVFIGIFTIAFDLSFIYFIVQESKK